MNLNKDKQGGGGTIASLYLVQVTKTPVKETRAQRHLVYYMIGNTIIRTMALFTGTVQDDLSAFRPYICRRSRGVIKWTPYDSQKEDMKADYDYIIEQGVACKQSRSIAIVAKEEAQVFVFGEVNGGFMFKADGILELVGRLYIGEMVDPALGLREQLIESNSAMIEINQGVAVLIICDMGDIVLLKDKESKWNMRLVVPSSVLGPVNSSISGVKSSLGELILPKSPPLKLAEKSLVKEMPGLQDTFGNEKSMSIKGLAEPSSSVPEEGGKREILGSKLPAKIPIAKAKTIPKSPSKVKTPTKSPTKTPKLVKTPTKSPKQVVPPNKSLGQVGKLPVAKTPKLSPGRMLLPTKTPDKSKKTPGKSPLKMKTPTKSRGKLKTPKKSLGKFRKSPKKLLPMLAKLSNSDELSVKTLKEPSTSLPEDQPKNELFVQKSSGALGKVAEVSAMPPNIYKTTAGQPTTEGGKFPSAFPTSVFLPPLFSTMSESRLAAEFEAKLKAKKTKTAPRKTPRGSNGRVKSQLFRKRTLPKVHSGERPKTPTGDGMKVSKSITFKASPKMVQTANKIVATYSPSKNLTKSLTKLKTPRKTLGKVRKTLKTPKKVVSPVLKTFGKEEELSVKTLKEPSSSVPEELPKKKLPEQGSGTKPSPKQDDEKFKNRRNSSFFAKPPMLSTDDGKPKDKPVKRTESKSKTKPAAIKSKSKLQTQSKGQLQSKSKSKLENKSKSKLESKPKNNLDPKQNKKTSISKKKEKSDAKTSSKNKTSMSKKKKEKAEKSSKKSGKNTSSSKKKDKS